MRLCMLGALGAERPHTLILMQNGHFLAYELSDFYETFQNRFLDPNMIHKSTKS